MRFSRNLLLQSLIAAASAASDAKVYLFHGDELPHASNPPTLSPEQARLVFAQRLGISRYHGLKDASADTLEYITAFGGQHETLFQETPHDKPSELVLVVEGVPSSSAKALLDKWPSIKPAFTISNPPSAAANIRLGEDLSRQLPQTPKCAIEDAANPFTHCWNGKSKFIHYDLSQHPSELQALVNALESLPVQVQQGAMNVLMVLMPESSRLSKSKPSPYGIYEMPSQAQLGRRQVEEPINDGNLSPLRSKQTKTSSTTTDPIVGVPPLCYSSHESCTEKTNSCSGHGKCYKKRGEVGKNACFACGCTAQKETFLFGPQNKTGVRITYWGGAACQKKDVSSPFWLIGGFTVVLVGLISWGIGMMYSIGEEKLPGVIGAGVSSNRAR